MTTDDNAQQLWRATVYAYASAVNAYIEKGLTDGWENAGEEPEIADGDVLVPELLEALRDANRHGRRIDIKPLWPPSHASLHKGGHLKENGQCIPTVCWLPDGHIVARIGEPYQNGKVVRIAGDAVSEVAGITHFGRCPRRRYFAVATTDGVEITDGWAGPRVASCPWPRGDEGIPPELAVAMRETPPAPTQLIPFPDGHRVLLVSPEGVFVLAPDDATRLLPTLAQIAEHNADDGSGRRHPYRPTLAMEHGAISPDGQLIAIGAQDGRHLVFDAALRPVAEIGPHSEYPHYADFSADGQTVIFNACHLYHGATIAIPVAQLAGLSTAHYEAGPAIHVVEPGARVYAVASRGDDFILGDAYGYLRAVARDGTYRWQHYIGSTISALDLSEDGRSLAAATCAGYLSLIDLDAGRQQPYQIGNGWHYEHRRWLFWKNEPTPLAW